MMDFIEGRIEWIDKNSIIVNVNGFGIVLIPVETLVEKLETGMKTRIYTSLVFNINNGSFEVYGFDTREKRDLFEKLRGVSKIGPKTALRVLSTVEPSDLIDMITSEDVDGLSKLAGVGKRSAERMVLELKNKFERVGTGKSVFSDAVEALVNLGYSPKMASYAVREAMKNVEFGTDVSQVVKESLKILLSEVRKK